MRLKTLPLALALTLAVSWTPADAMICELNVPPVLSITDETGDFTLLFTNFLSGTLSSTQQVSYRVQANNMATGTVSPAITARLGSLFDTVELQADISSYTNAGNDRFAALQEVNAGPITVAASATPLANKSPGVGHFDYCLDGNLVITWRAKLTTDTPAGSENRSLIVTLRDGS